MKDKLRVLSLFSGIGGIDLGLERAGMYISAHSEVDDYCNLVLNKQWPGIPNLGDINSIVWEDHIGKFDVIAGGFPCQDISRAGKGAGIKDGTRSGLWFKFEEGISVLRPRYVIVENVNTLLGNGLGTVLGSLAALGYDCWWDCVPASAVGAPHRRDRLFVIAYRSDVDSIRIRQGAIDWAEESANEASVYSNCERCSQLYASSISSRQNESDRDVDGRGSAADSENNGLENGGTQQNLDGSLSVERSGIATDTSSIGYEGQGWTKCEECSRSYSEWEANKSFNACSWRAEPGVGRVAHGVPDRVDRLKGLGNAVVPQVAQYIGEIVVDTYNNN